MESSLFESCGFEQVGSSAELASALEDARRRLFALASDMGGLQLMTACSDLTDLLVERVFRLAVQKAAVDDSGVPDVAGRLIAVAAVGGYGRREMAPFSDIDVAFLADDTEDIGVELVLKRAFRLLMEVADRLRLTVGYSYRRVEDVAHLDLEAQTALLDARLVVGSPQLFERFSAALRSSIKPAVFVAGHLRSRADLSRRGGSPYLVEPDVKEGRGGLRDLQTARWLAQVAFGLGRDDVLEGLQLRGLLTEERAREIDAAADFICRVRCLLHLTAGRALEVLGRERQAAAAERLGLPDSASLMSCYYQHAGSLWRFFRSVAAECESCELEVEPGITVCGGRLNLADPGLIRREPAAMVALFEHARKLDVRVDVRTSDLVAGEVNRIAAEHGRAGADPASATENSPLGPEACRIFLDTLSGPGTGAALREMAETGVLGLLIPEFVRLMALIPADQAHLYSVGEHSLRAIEELEKLFSRDAEMFGDLLSRVQRLEVLFLAVLLHDVGKLCPEEDHSAAGAAIAARIAGRLGLSSDSCERVAFLVRNHLLLGETARLRDLSRQKTVEDVAARVGDPQLLDMLTLLTVADSRAVGTRNWNRVQLRFLMELHERAMALLRAPNGPRADLDRHRTRVRRDLRLASLPPDEVDEHCDAMPPEYLLNTPGEEMAAHISHVRTVRAGEPAIELQDQRGQGFTRLTVAAPDRQGLLCRIAGVLYAQGIDVHAAQIYTRVSADRIAIDILYIDFEGRQLSETKKWQLQDSLREVLTGRQTVEELLHRCRKPRCVALSNVKLRVVENISDRETVLELRGQDVPGLLYHLTSQIAKMGWTIRSARVATWGHEACDVFYVTDAEGRKPDSDQLAHFERLLTACED